MKFFTMFLCAASIVVSGCSSSNSVVGTWKSSETGRDSSATFEIKADNTFSAQMTGTRSDSISGNYKLDGKTLTFTPTMEDGKPSSDEALTVTLSDDMKSFDMPGSGKMVKQ